MLVTRCRSCSLQKLTRYSLQKLLVAKRHSLLVAEVARCKKSLVARSKKSLVSRCEIPSIFIAKNHSSLKQSHAEIIVCLKSTKLDESFSFFNVNYFLGKIYKWVKSQQLLALSQRNEKDPIKHPNHFPTCGRWQILK